MSMFILRDYNLLSGIHASSSEKKMKMCSSSFERNLMHRFQQIIAMQTVSWLPPWARRQFYAHQDCQRSRQTPVMHVEDEAYRINHKLFIEIEAARWRSLGGADGDVQHEWKLELTFTMQPRLLRHAIMPSECSSRLIKIQFQRTCRALCEFKDIFHVKFSRGECFKLKSTFFEAFISF